MATAREIREEIELTASDEVRGAMLRVHLNVTSMTPVATGHAASNWLLSVGTPDSSVAGSRESVDWSPSRAGRERMMTYHVRQGRVYMRNNVPYIGPLNNGWSKQASAGFVERAFAGGASVLPSGQKRPGARILRAMGTSSIHRGGRVRGFRGVNARDVRSTR